MKAGENADSFSAARAQRDAILQEARAWACEAKTQRATVNEVGSALGGVPDWGPIASSVRERLAAGDAAQAQVETLAVALRDFFAADDEVAAMQKRGEPLGKGKLHRYSLAKERLRAALASLEPRA